MFESEMPIGCLACTSSFLIAGGYSFDCGLRTGKVYLYGKDDMKIRRELPTSGTLDIKVSNDVFYLANSEDIACVSLRNGNSIERGTTGFNTYISLGNDQVFVSDIGGNVKIYDGELNAVETVKAADDPVWVSEIYGKELVSGCEAGSLSFIDTRIGRKHQMMKRECGITSIYMGDGYLYVGSYDEHVEMIDMRNYGIVKRTRIGGGVWKIASRDARFYLSCMYEGMKMCDSNLDVLERYDTESIVYGLALSGDKLFFTSFYDKKIYVGLISEWLGGHS